MKFGPLPSILLAFAGCLAIASAQVHGPMQAAPTAADKAKLDNCQKAYAKAKILYAKSPKDPKAKERLVIAATLYADESMLSPVLEPRVKYPQALRLFSEILKLDPKNKHAKTYSDEIVRIYKQMGRPIPKH